MLFDDRNDVLHADLASLARYVVTIIRGMVIDAIWGASLSSGYRAAITSFPGFASTDSSVPRLCEVLDRGKGQQTVVVKHVTANADDRVLGRLGGPESRSARRRLHAALADEGRGLGRRHELDHRMRGVGLFRHRQHADGIASKVKSPP